MKAFLFCATICLCSCGTVSPNYTVNNVASYDENGLQNGGVEGEVIDKKTGAKMILRPYSDHALFNKLAAKYGSQFMPPVTPNEGMIAYGNEWAFRNDILTSFAVMKGMAKMDAAK